MYEQIASNKKKSSLLIFIFVFLISLIGFVFGFAYSSNTTVGIIFMIITLFFAGIIVVINYYKGDKLILKVSGARKPNKEEHAYLMNVVDGIAIAAGVPKPQLYIIDDSAPNAFATGRDPKHASIAVTSGLLKKLNRLELEGVIAHEMSHIKNYDIRLMMLASVLVGTVVIIADFMMRSMIHGRSGRKGNPIILAIAFIFIILSPVFAYLLQHALSREREYLADASAALLTRYPEGLANALAKLDADTDALEVANRGTEPLYIVTPQNLKGKLSGLFSTHPDINERIKRLKAM